MGEKSLAFLEAYGDSQEVEDWHFRQLRKVYGALQCRDEKCTSAALVGDSLTIAELGAEAKLGIMDVVEGQFKLIEWKVKHANLENY